jgi:hypothetical protein
MKREVLSMEADESTESVYRILIGGQVKYIRVDPGTYDIDTLSFPPHFLDQLPELPVGGWTHARIFKSSSNISFELSSRPLAGVRSRWHPNIIDILSLPSLDLLDIRVQLVTFGSTVAVAKIARFELEIPSTDNETAIYQAIDGHGIGPAFLGHLTEHGRVMGFLIEQVEGRHAHIDDLKGVRELTNRLHSLGIVHGDLNRHNFIVSPDGRITLIDFENAIQNGTQKAMEMEYERIPDQLLEETGRGGVVREEIE